MGEQWKFGKILQRLGNLHYQVKLDNEFVSKKHINQLKRTEVPEARPISIQSQKEETKKEEKPKQKVTFKNEIENSDFIIIPQNNHQPDINPTNHQFVIHHDQNRNQIQQPDVNPHPHQFVNHPQQQIQLQIQPPRRSLRPSRPPNRFTP